MEFRIATHLEDHDRQHWDATKLKERLVGYMVHVGGRDPDHAEPRDWFHALAHLLRGILGERLVRTQRLLQEHQGRRVYYLSMEYLIGRTLEKTLIDLGLLELTREVLAQCGQDYDAIRRQEAEPGLGNGGLGRLAACILDSLATQGYAGFGYGLRYKFGLFSQAFEQGEQVERPDYWLPHGNPWEFQQPSVTHAVRFNGRLVRFRDPATGQESSQWVETEDILAQAYDLPLSGYHSPTVSNLRLWAAQADRRFNLREFNEGDYLASVREKVLSENLTKVLYPSDQTPSGQELRLKQEYFFVSATLQDILAQFLATGGTLRELPERVAIHLNDTHPALAVPELLRLLVDEHHISLEEAWELTCRTFFYTNHTLLPEALETWPVHMLARILPRHMELIYIINHWHLVEVRRAFPGDSGILGRMSLLDDYRQLVRMAHLAVVASQRVNGVARLHTDLMRQGPFADFHHQYPEKLVNVTNGITFRRWLLQANPGLASLITRRIGGGWVTDPTQLESLAGAAGDGEFRRRFREVKSANKARLADLIQQRLGVAVSPHSLFDVQVKRIHEYKRQLLNLLHVITLYRRIREGREEDPVARTVIFAGKAAPGYAMAKRIIHLINDVAETINHDPAVGERLKVVFLPNYGVSLAEWIIPGSDLSEQISTAGTEASGTGNMKLSLNGALTIGTLDGANIEIHDRVGAENIFIFGLDARGVGELRQRGYDPARIYEENAELKATLEMIRDGFFSPDDPSRYVPVFDALVWGGDHFLLLADFASYLACQEEVARQFRDPEEWSRRAILNVARVGPFSIDRTVREYAQRIWGLEPLTGP